MNNATELIRQVIFLFPIPNSQFPIPQHGSVKGEREKGIGEIQTFSPFPLTFSQTTREMKISYPNRIALSPIPSKIIMTLVMHKVDTFCWIITSMNLYDYGDLAILVAIKKLIR